MSNASIVLKNVYKTFGKGEDAVHALREISLEIFPGHLSMIVGPSGCGKTTLLSVIAGTLHADTGEVKVLSELLDLLSDEELTHFRARHVGFIFQQYHLIPTLTCAENVAVPLLIQGIERTKALDEAIRTLALVGIEDKAWRYPKLLSGGQQQRVAIARAIVHNPQLIICDEPTAALDFENGIRVMKILSEIAQESKRTVLVVTHDHRIFQYASTIIEMDDGLIKTINSSQTQITQDVRHV